MNGPDTLSYLLKALSEPLRVRIMLLLREAEELCVCDLVSILEVSQSMVSRHLSYLRGAGWVESRRDGLWMHYRITASLPVQQELLTALASHGASDALLASDLAKLRTMTTACPPGRCC